MLKKSLLILLGLIFGMQAQAQRFGVVDSDLVLTKLPEYKKAQQQLDQLSRTWESEVEALMKEAEEMRKSYEAEKVLLTDKMKEKRLKAIKEKEKEAREKQKLYFGSEGKMHTKRLELIKPIQDKIYNAVRQVAQRRNLDAVFDKSSDLITLYLNEEVNISKEVIKKLEESKNSN